MITQSQAKELIDLARQSIRDFFENKKTSISDKIKKDFGKKQGAFVSVYVKDELNGCMGYPLAIKSLYEAVVEMARFAAFEDPRFPPLLRSQMKDLRIEISVLTVPEEIKVKKAEEYLKKFRVGEDGLIVHDELGGSGLLLPQVAVEWKWNEEEFLNQTCVKAGLNPDCWRDLRHKVYKFQAQVFTEKNGKVVKKQ
jgi:hypothetical protein